MRPNIFLAEVSIIQDLVFFPLHFWGVNNMYWESEGGEFLYPWRKGGFHQSVVPPVRNEYNPQHTTTQYRSQSLPYTSSPVFNHVFTCTQISDPPVMGIKPFLRILRSSSPPRHNLNLSRRDSQIFNS